MIARVLEPELMDTALDAHDYNLMDHSAVNQLFSVDFCTACPSVKGTILDVGTGTALITIVLCRLNPNYRFYAVDLADEMLKLAAVNVATAGFTDRIKLAKINARQMTYETGFFAAVMSNSVLHHIPHPFECISEMVRVCETGGQIFARDLLRPSTNEQLEHLVNLHAAGANPHQRQLFAESLRAALTLAEMQTLVVELGFDPNTVRQTSDRHWTWSAVVS
jgi:ubiquinone/menaquinone biosynthesis C-methylase UbiE